VVIVPLAFLLTEARGAGAGQVAALIARPLTGQLLWNTVRLAVAVTILCAIIGTGAAWLTERTNLPGRRVWAVLIVVPLAIPDFVVSFGRASLSMRSSPPKERRSCWAGRARRCSRHEFAHRKPAVLIAALSRSPRRGRTIDTSTTGPDSKSHAHET
jgi:ABC-type Fe3+ transport system permease subunit